MTRVAVAAAVTLAAVAAAALARTHASANRFEVVPLVSDVGLGAPLHDRALVNPWGLAASPSGPWWTANEARGSSTLYSGAGRKQLLSVAVACGPTGIVYYGGSRFRVSANGASDPARFVFACEDGTIRAWTPTVPAGWSTSSEVVYRDPIGTAIFRGLARAGDVVYATDFHDGRVEVLDGSWRRIDRAGRFRDPSLPQWYAPFGIAVLGGRVFVTYVFRAPVDGNDAPTGGYVDEFTLGGRLVARVASHLNEPWGLALAPRGFGAFGGDLLVGDFGDGRITAFRRAGGEWRRDGALAAADGKPLVVNGLWALAFGNGAAAGPRTTLFFTSGPHEWRGPTEQSVHGLLGAIRRAA
ncbi:MAG TPA: TIGR03118 family protein [Gaiellaceae bacterium]|nr:TIGR03118 family protein [Gaiellaceae bacterium]